MRDSLDLALLILGLVVLLVSIKTGWEKFARIERTLQNLNRELREELNKIRDLCTPLAFMNVFDSHKSLLIGGDVQLQGVLTDLETAEKKRLYFIRHLERLEESELRQFEKDHGTVADFSPSEWLKKAMIDAATAIAMRRIAYDNFQTTKGIFLDALNEKINIIDAQKTVNAKLKPLNIGFQGIDVAPDFDQQDPRVKNEIEKILHYQEKCWKNGKWKDRLSHYRELERYKLDAG